MNTNCIKKDGFSNPETKQLFDECWIDDALSDEHCTALCGLCTHGFFLDPPDLDWVLCLNRDGPHAFETVSSLFTCPAHEPNDEEPDELTFDPPHFSPESWD
ncbi:MAG: hypothetical protein AB9869_33455 [Verrucomicrobiia bacterium]